MRPEFLATPALLGLSGATVLVLGLSIGFLRKQRIVGKVNTVGLPQLAPVNLEPVWQDDFPAVKSRALINLT